MTRRSAEDFVGTDRFLVQRRLGSGAYGVVFETYDRHEDALVALKVLHNADADALYRFKKGFRSFADIRHRNLAALYELLSEDGFWFFTMELVAGVDLIAYLCHSDDRRHPTGGSSVDRFASGAWDEDTEVEVSKPAETAPVANTVDHDKVRDVWRQLAHGLHALHQHGKLHRDIKPSNVMIAPAEQRLILLDFGLVAELEGALQSVVSPNIGTPAYMSPEQAMGHTCTPASDWYSVGVMLYEVLVGALPFGGSLAEMMAYKRGDGWVREGLESLDVPEDLKRLCEGLLRPELEDRWNARDVFALLDTVPEEPVVAASSALSEQEFVGREEALESLREALAVSRHEAVLFYLRGSSGMGKTALVHRFLDELEQDGGDAVVLMGRCYQQESVPYKAFDSLIDALTRYLRTLDDHDVEVLLPTRFSALLRLFPVLRRVPAVANLGGEDELIENDPQRLRRRAATALRRLLMRLSERRNLILFIDDLQWGDADSFALLERLVRPPDPPALLLIGCYRSEDEASSPFLRRLAEQRIALGTRGVDVRDLELAELSAEDARRLVRMAIERGDFELTEEQIRKIIREARGSPFFLSELMRTGLQMAQEHRAENGDGAAGTPSSAAGAVPRLSVVENFGTWQTGEFQLTDLILSRVADLPGEARQMLEAIAVAGRPIDVDAAAEAAGIKAGRSTILSLLLNAKLVRRSASEEREEVEMYHDRIREALVETLDAHQLRDRHRLLATVLESSGRAEPETLAVHFKATADTERARSYAMAAASRAEEALAFDHAARLYEMALELLPKDSSDESSEHYELRVRLGDALASAGRNREAAETFLAAASDSGSINPVEAQRSAAENLLISGHIERGLAVLNQVLSSVKLSFEERPWRAMFELWWRRLGLRAKSFKFKPREESTCSPRELRRIDVCWSAETGLCLVDILQASLFHARHLHFALRVGEPQRVARGLAMEVFFGPMEGADPRQALERARDLAGRVEGTYAASLTEVAAGMQSCSEGAWGDAERRLNRADRYLRETGAGIAWELDTVRHFQILALVYLGRWRDLFDRIPSWLEEARRRGDLYLEVHLIHWGVCLQFLCRDRPREALDSTREAGRRWTKNGFHYQHFGQLMAETQALLYSGRGRKAWRLVNGRWTALARSMLQRIEMVHVQSYDLRGRAALAAASDPRTREDTRQRLLAQVARDAVQVAKTRSNWGQGLAAMLLGCRDHARNQAASAREQFRAAEQAFEACQMPVHALVARHRLCQLEDPALSAGTLDDVRARLRRLGIASPNRLSAMLAPGRGWREKGKS